MKKEILMKREYCRSFTHTHTIQSVIHLPACMPETRLAHQVNMLRKSEDLQHQSDSGFLFSSFFSILHSKG